MRDVKAAVRLPHWDPMLAMRLIAISVFVVAASGTVVSAQARDRAGPDESGGHEMMMFGGPPEHVGRSVDHMLDGLNASEAQRGQIKQIAISAAADLQSQRDAGRGLRAKAMQIFAAPTVDASAAEAVRQQISAQRDQGSKRMLQAMLDVAKVLTPEQRATLGERVSDRHAVRRDRMQRMKQERAAGGTHSSSQPAPQK